MAQRLSAHYMIAKFLRSKESTSFNLNSIEALLLRCVADYIDMSDRKECRARSSVIAFECKYSARWISKSLKKLCEKNLLRRERRWKMFRYYLGEYFTSTTLANNRHPVPRSDDILSVDQGTIRPMTIDKEIKNKRDRVNIDQTSFNLFWDVYPRKIGRQKAEQVWLAKNLDTQTHALIDDITLRIKNDEQWQDKKFIPYPATYLNEERWTDEINEVNHEGPKNSSQLNRRQASMQGYIEHLERSKH